MAKLLASLIGWKEMTGSLIKGELTRRRADSTASKQTLRQCIFLFILLAVVYVCVTESKRLRFLLIIFAYFGGKRMKSNDVCDAKPNDSMMSVCLQRKAKLIRINCKS